MPVSVIHTDQDTYLFAQKLFPGEAHPRFYFSVCNRLRAVGTLLASGMQLPVPSPDMLYVLADFWLVGVLVSLVEALVELPTGEDDFRLRPVVEFVSGRLPLGDLGDNGD